MARAEEALMQAEEEGNVNKNLGVRGEKNAFVKRNGVEPAPPSTPADLQYREAPLLGKVAKKRRVDVESPIGSDDEHPPDDVIERDLLGFCCHTCRCPDDKEDYMPASEDGGVHRYLQSCPDSLYHRSCCHGVRFMIGDEWATLYEAAIDRIGNDEFNGDDDDDGNDYRKHSDFRWVTKMEIHASYRTAKSQESALFNADGDEHPRSRLETNADYFPGVVKPYKALCEKVQEIEESNRQRVVVLDAFAGVGTGVVALKRLGIDIAKVIHVEHDKVATHVYRWNHDHTYNTELPDDDIQHVFVEKWEDFDRDWESFCDKHGRKFD